MIYIFDSLKNNERFELLLRKGIEKVHVNTFKSTVIFLMY